MAETLTELRERVAKMEAIADKLERTPADPTRAAAVPDHPPSIRKGEDPLSSRPFRFIRALALASKQLPEHMCKVEKAIMDGFREQMFATNAVMRDMRETNYFIPFGWGLLPDEVTHSEVGRQFKSMIAAGQSEVQDPQETFRIAQSIEHYRKRPDVVKAALTPSQSYLDSTLGGTLVAPPTQGDIIPLMRNQSALDRAGAQQFALPPQGKAVFPRQSSASTFKWIGENTTIDLSTIGTGQMALEAKKAGAAVVVPNDLFKFTSGSADRLIQSDLAKTLALGMDYAGLYGAGSGGQPKGLVNYTGSNELYDYAAATPTPKGVQTDGNVVYPEDAQYMMGAIEDRNFDLDSEGWSWIMRGSMFRRLNAVRADAVAASDEAGPFVSAITQLLGEKIGNTWSGYNVTRSSQVRTNQTKASSGAILTEIFGGCWSQCVLAMYGAVEIATSPGENAFLADQTIIRAIMYGDVGYRYPGAFAYYKQLVPRYTSASS